MNFDSAFVEWNEMTMRNNRSIWIFPPVYIDKQWSVFVKPEEINILKCIYKQLSSNLLNELWNVSSLSDFQRCQRRYILVFH